MSIVSHVIFANTKCKLCMKCNDRKNVENVKINALNGVKRVKLVKKHQAIVKEIATK